jgi:hypothetical protein
MLALQALPIARELAPFLGAREHDLAHITEALIAAEEKDEPVLLGRLTRLSCLPVYRHNRAARYRISRRSKKENRRGDLLDLGPCRKIGLWHVPAVYRRIHD